MEMETLTLDNPQEEHFEIWFEFFQSNDAKIRQI